MTTWDEFAARLSAVLSTMPLGAGVELRQAARPLDEPFVTITRELVSILDVVRCAVRPTPGRPLSEATVGRLVELGWRPPSSPYDPLLRLLPDGSTDEQRSPVVAAILALFRVVEQVPAPDGLTYRAWYAEPGAGRPAEEILVSQLGLDPLRVEHFVRLDEGDTTTDPGALFRVINVGATERVEARTREGGDWSPTVLPEARVVPVDEFRARYVAARWSPSRFRLSRSLGVNLDHEGATVDRSWRRQPDLTVLNYLSSAPPISDPIGDEPNPFHPDRFLIGRRDLHSDGVWIWPASLRHPEPDLLRHIEANGGVVPELAEADIYAAHQLFFG